MSRKTENVTFDAGALEFYNAPSDSYDNDEGNEKENVGVKKSLWSKMSSSSRYVSLNENKVNRSKKDPCQSTSLFGEKNHWDVNPSQDAKKSKKISLKKGIKNLLYPLVVLMIFSTIPLTAGNILPKADRSIWFSDLTQLDSSSKSAFDYLGIEYIDVPGSLVFEANVSFSVNLTKNYGEGPCPLCDFSCKVKALNIHSLHILQDLTRFVSLFWFNTIAGQFEGNSMQSWQQFSQKLHSLQLNQWKSQCVNDCNFGRIQYYYYSLVQCW